MTLDFGLDPIGATPLGDAELIGLIPRDVRTRADLNLLEATNILRAQKMFLEKRNDPLTVLDDVFVRQLHRAMFDQVWSWAGQYRTRELNIGVPFVHIAERVKILIENSRFQLEDGADLDELACHLHHQLTFIHPFANGNGRCARLMADVFLVSAGEPAFSWGSSKSISATESRTQYIEALRAADTGDLTPLMAFARG